MTDQVASRVQALARARLEARTHRDWATADRLRAEIEDAGWKVIDEGGDFRLVPGHPPDITDGGRIRHGRSGSVPSRLEDPPVGLATVVLVEVEASDAAPALRWLRDHGPAGTSVVVVVADDPSPELRAVLRDDADDGPSQGTLSPPTRELVRTSDQLTPAASVNAGCRRASGPVVILLDPRAEPTGDFVTPLVRALDDPTIAIAGALGVVSSDVRRFLPAAVGEVDALDGRCIAFRREELASRGPLDERFRSDRYLGLWWSLVLREAAAGAPPRRALALDLPLRFPEASWLMAPEDHEGTRIAKRDFYRFFDSFGHRRDLLTSPQVERQGGTIRSDPADPGPPQGR